MKSSIGVLAIIGVLSTACKSHDLNTTDSSEVRSSAASLIGKSFSISCTRQGNDNPVLRVNTLKPLRAENEPVDVSADWFGSTPFEKLAGKLTAAGTAGDRWNVAVKSVAPAFFAGKFEGEFRLDTLTSVKGEWWDPAREIDESHNVSCKLLIGTGAIQEGVAPQAARYKCQSRRTLETFISRDACLDSKCPNPDDCVKVQ